MKCQISTGKFLEFIQIQVAFKAIAKDIVSCCAVLTLIRILPDVLRFSLRYSVFR